MWLVKQPSVPAFFRSIKMVRLLTVVKASRTNSRNFKSSTFMGINRDSRCYERGVICAYRGTVWWSYLCLQGHGLVALFVPAGAQFGGGESSSAADRERPSASSCWARTTTERCVPTTDTRFAARETATLGLIHSFIHSFIHLIIHLIIQQSTHKNYIAITCTINLKTWAWIVRFGHGQEQVNYGRPHSK